MNREDSYSFIYDQMSDEEKLRLEVVQSLSESCDRNTYEQKLEEAAQKLGKSKRTVQRLMKEWKENGVSALFPTTRADKSKHRVSKEWQEFIQNTYTEERMKGRWISIKEVALKVQERATELGEADFPSERTIRRVLKNIYEPPEDIYGEEGQRQIYRISIPIKGEAQMHIVADSHDQALAQAINTWDYQNIRSCQVSGDIMSRKIDLNIDDLDIPRKPPGRKFLPKPNLVRKNGNCIEDREKSPIDYIEYEETIAWLQDRTKFPWVRCWEPTPIPWRAGLHPSLYNREGIVIVGYSEVRVNTPFLDGEDQEYYYRRLFTINKDDYKNYPPGKYPSEAKLTASIEVGVLGIHPKHA